ncbi:hypothetical protein ABIC83_002754 [Roseateles asaccharophilus]|uniref:hypothetical protein n=1 Tax=Roseateles asaccharophilus TaxID=582607 RepID=UPI003837600B
MAGHPHSTELWVDRICIDRGLAASQRQRLAQLIGETADMVAAAIDEVAPDDAPGAARDYLKRLMALRQESLRSSTVLPVVVIGWMAETELLDQFATSVATLARAAA